MVDDILKNKLMLNFCLTYCSIIASGSRSLSMNISPNIYTLGRSDCTQAIDMTETHNITTRQKKTDTMQQGKPQKPTAKAWVRPLWFLTTIGWYVALSLVIPTAIGYWLDRPSKLNTHPLFTLIGFGVGTVVAFLGLYLMLRRFYKEQKEENKGVKN